MDYLEFSFLYSADASFIGDLLSVELAEIGFESFVETPNGLEAYVPVPNFNENNFKITLNAFEYNNMLTYTQKLVKGQNWNEEWEKHYFQPIIIGDDCAFMTLDHIGLKYILKR